MTRKQKTGLAAGIFALVIVTASASALMLRDPGPPDVEPAAGAVKEEVTWNEPPAQPAQQPAVNCDDGNIVGMIAGGVGGGLVGSQIGDGDGQTAATIGGAIGGAYLGKEYLPTQNATCPK